MLQQRRRGNELHVTRIAYFVHDLDDAAVARRVSMLVAAGADVQLAGFHRSASPPSQIAGVACQSLGQTADAKLGQRLRSVMTHLANPLAIKAITKNADVIIGRNLEALALGARARSGQRLIYECLDIHRTLTGSSLQHRAIQAIEARLLRDVDLLIVSSPAFLINHFEALLTSRTETLLVENKVFAATPLPMPIAPPPGPPWTIGWFGMLRCEKTLRTLTELASRAKGKVRILIAGKPSAAVFTDFEAAVAASPHCRYMGAYAADDLPRLYSMCHFAWSIDWFEQGLNSSWLLPNRIYEASANECVPIALTAVETGRWLARHNAGVLVRSDTVIDELHALIGALTVHSYAKMRDAIAEIPRTSVVAGIDDCRDLLAAVVGRAS